MKYFKSICNIIPVFVSQVAGADEYGYPMERMTSTAISAQLPGMFFS